MSFKKEPLSRLVRPLPKGQVTIPIAFRRRLNINDRTLLSVAVKGEKIEISPVRQGGNEKKPREYSDAEIQRFLKEDRIDPKIASRVRRLLGKRSAR